MRVPLSWLAEYVDLPAGADAESVMAELVKVGLEEEGVHGFSVTGPIVVGRVISFEEEPQSNGKTIRWCQVQVANSGQGAADGGADIRGIVCGASNFEVDDKVVVCLPGAVLPGPFEIAARKTYGHVSDGMLASARELGLGDDHSGIIRLGQLGLDPKVGTDAIEVLCLNDEAAEINVTPDRGYCLSIRGVAREYSHATGSDFRDPTGNAHTVYGQGFDLKIADDAPIRGVPGCSNFVVRSVRGIDPSRPTPPWMVARLKLAGMRSISLVVDITNYVMLELGQPIHAYDADKLKGGITVRRAKAGETLKTLDGQTRKLNKEDLLITDKSGPIGLAGVMGGESTEVSGTTTNVLIEAATFDPISIARTARRHKLPSEASKRFERGVDPLVAEFAAARVVQLLEVHAWGAADSLGADYRALEAKSPIWLPAEFAAGLVGVDYSHDEIVDTLSQVGCTVASVAGGYEVTPPSWRPDLTHKTDLVEEIARISGYDRIPTRLPVAPPGRGLTRAQAQRRKVANALAAFGVTEVLNYPFLSPVANQRFNGAEELAVVRLANPLQEDFAELRTWLLPGLIDAARRNLSRGLSDLAIFETGLVFLPEKKLGKTADLPVGNERPEPKRLASLEATIPAQPRHLAAVFAGARVGKQVGQSEIVASYQDAIQAARVVARALGLELIFEQAQPAGFHPGRTATLWVANGTEKTNVGVAGELDPALTAELDLPRRVAAFELDLDLLGSLAPEVVKASPIGVLPAATQDLSLVVAESVAAGDLLQTILVGAGSLLEHAEIVDEYRGANLAEGTKSVTFALRFRALDRTLTQAEASEAKQAAVDLAASKYQATIRA